jgi:hypothetical protein
LGPYSVLEDEVADFVLLMIWIGLPISEDFDINELTMVVSSMKVDKSISFLALIDVFFRC